MRVAIIQSDGRVYDVVALDTFLQQPPITQSGWLTEEIDDDVLCSQGWLRAAFGVYQDIAIPVRSFDNELRKRLDAVDGVTAGLIVRGHEFPLGSGDYYSLSVQAQLMLVGVAGNLSESLPVAWWTIDSSKEILLLNPTSYFQFFNSAFSTVKEARFSGAQLRRLLHACSSPEDLDDIVDSRITDSSQITELNDTYKAYLALQS